MNFPGTVSGVDAAEVADAQMRAFGLHLRHDFQQVRHRAREAVELRHDQTIIAVPQKVERQRQLRPVADTRHLLAKDPVASCLLEFGKLGFEPGDWTRVEVRA